MAEGLNRVMLLGNLGAEPELRFTAAGQAVLNIRLATTESYLDKDKVRRERTDWHSVTIWGKRGEALAKILTKGSSIFIEGSLRTSSYDNREGVKVYKTEIIANNVVLTGGRGHSDAGEYSESAEDGAGGEGYAPRAAAPRAAAGGDLGDFAIGWGQNKGAKISELSSRDLAFHKGKIQGDLADPSKSQHHAKCARQLASIEALEARLGGGGAPPATGGYARGGKQADTEPRPKARAPEPTGQTDDDSGGYGGGDEPAPDSIPF